MTGIYFTCCSYLLIILFVLSKSFRLRKSKVLSVLNAIIFGIILGFFTSQSQTYFIRTICMLIYFLYVFILFDISLLISIITTTFLLFLIATSEWTVMLIDAGGMINIFDPLNMDFSYFLALLIGIIFFFVYSLFFVRMFEIINSDSYPKSKWLLLIPPIFTFILILSIPDYFEMVGNHQILTLSILGLIASNFIMLYFYTYSIRAMRLDSELSMIKSKQEYLEEKVQLVNQHYTHSFNYLHRFLHECNDLNHYVETKDMEKIEALAIQMGEEAGKEFNMLYSNSLALNTVLQQNSKQIQELNIRIMTTILCDLEEIELSDQIKLYEVLLDRAIFNCAKCDKQARQISILVKEINSKKAIRISSAFQDDEDAKIEESLKDIIKKYSMRYNRQVEDNKEMILLLL